MGSACLVSPDNDRVVWWLALLGILQFSGLLKLGELSEWGNLPVKRGNFPGLFYEVGGELAGNYFMRCTVVGKGLVGAFFLLRTDATPPALRDSSRALSAA